MSVEVLKGKLISHLVAIISFLLTVVTGLVAYYGSETLRSLKELNQAFYLEHTTNAVVNAVQDNRIAELEKEKQHNALQSNNVKVFAKKEDGFDLKNLK